MGGNQDASRPALEGRGEGWHGTLGGLQGRGYSQVFHLLPDGGGKVGNVQLQCIQGGAQLRGDPFQGLQEALVEEEAAMELAQAACLGDRAEELGGAA